MSRVVLQQKYVRPLIDTDNVSLTLSAGVVGSLK